MSKQKRMYRDVVTWNPFKGCEFDCVYCRPSFQRLAKMQKTCAACRSYEPHEHPERLAKVPKGETVFVCSSGDISFATPGYMQRIIRAMHDNPRAAWYLQSKRPGFFEPWLGGLPENTYLLTTLETNRDEGYAEVSNAPPPYERWGQFCRLQWLRKAVTVEPIMDFDVDEFAALLGVAHGYSSAANDHIWIGYNTTRHAAPIPEASPEKVAELLARLVDAGLDVRGKELRGLVVPER